jgi:hypothetical protein
VEEEEEEEEEEEICKSKCFGPHNRAKCYDLLFLKMHAVVFLGLPRFGVAIREPFTEQINVLTQDRAIPK